MGFEHGGVIGKKETQSAVVQTGAGLSLVQMEDVSMAARAKVCHAETMQGLGIWESRSLVLSSTT